VDRPQRARSHQSFLHQGILVVLVEVTQEEMSAVADPGAAGSPLRILAASMSPLALAGGTPLPCRALASPTPSWTLQQPPRLPAVGHKAETVVEGAVRENGYCAGTRGALRSSGRATLWIPRRRTIAAAADMRLAKGHPSHECPLRLDTIERNEIAVSERSRHFRNRPRLLNRPEGATRGALPCGAHYTPALSIGKKVRPLEDVTVVAFPFPQMTP